MLVGDDRAREEAQVEIAAMAARLLAKLRDKIIDGTAGLCAHQAPRLGDARRVVGRVPRVPVIRGLRARDGRLNWRLTLLLFDFLNMNWAREDVLRHWSRECACGLDRVSHGFADVCRCWGGR